jgi:hypothetical protein
MEFKTLGAVRALISSGARFVCFIALANGSALTFRQSCEHNISAREPETCVAYGGWRFLLPTSARFVVVGMPPGNRHAMAKRIVVFEIACAKRRLSRAIANAVATSFPMKTKRVHGAYRPGKGQGARSDKELRHPNAEVNLSARAEWNYRQIAAHWNDVIFPHLLRASEKQNTHLATQSHCLALIREHTPETVENLPPRTRRTN